MVQLIKLDINGFGKFEKETVIDFKSGINFITGLNEAGKSTVLEAAMAAIFKYTPSQIMPFYCWRNEHICRTALTYKTDGGEVFRIISDYKSGKRCLEKIERGKAHEVATADKNIEPILKNHFGFDDRKVFENTAFIRQSQMAILEDSSVRNRIKDMIEEVFAGRSEASATKALAKMKKIAKDSSKEIYTLEEECTDLKEKLESAEDTKESVVKDSGDYERVSKNLTDKQKKMEKMVKNKRLFDEKKALEKDLDNVNTQLEQVEDFLESVPKDAEIQSKSTPNKAIGIALAAVGLIVAIVGMSNIIGTIIGIIFIIGGIFKYRQQEKKIKPVKKVNEKSPEYAKRRRELINKKAVAERRLEDYKLVNFNSNDFTDLENLEQEVESLKERKVELQTSIKTTNELVDNPDDLREQLNCVETDIENLRIKIEEHELAAKFLLVAESEVHHKFTPAIEKDSKPILKEITNEKYSELKIDENTLDIEVKAPEIKKYVNISYLSQGTRDQLYFVLRKVMSDRLSGNVNVPLILDDPFHNFDEERLSKTMTTIQQIAKNKQIILISHRPYHKEFKNFAGNVIDL